MELTEKMKIHENHLKASLGLKDDSFIIKLLMPGEMLETNAMSINQDTLIWKFGLDSLLNNNYYHSWYTDLVNQYLNYQLLFFQY